VREARGSGRNFFLFSDPFCSQIFSLNLFRFFSFRPFISPHFALIFSGVPFLFPHFFSLSFTFPQKPLHLFENYKTTSNLVS